MTATVDESARSSIAWHDGVRVRVARRDRVVAPLPRLNRGMQR
jgi:hypothetical protein